MSRSLLENVTDISKDPFITFCICVLTVAVCLDTMWGCPVKLVYSPVITAISGCFTQRKYHLTRDLTRKVRVFEFFDKWIPAEYRFHLVLNIVKVEPQHKNTFEQGRKVAINKLILPILLLSSLTSAEWPLNSALQCLF